MGIDGTCARLERTPFLPGKAMAVLNRRLFCFAQLACFHTGACLEAVKMFRLNQALDGLPLMCARVSLAMVEGNPPGGGTARIRGGVEAQGVEAQ